MHPDRFGGGIGRHAGLKIPWAAMPVRVRFPSEARKGDWLKVDRLWSVSFLFSAGGAVQEVLTQLVTTFDTKTTQWYPKTRKYEDYRHYCDDFLLKSDTVVVTCRMYLLPDAIMQETQSETLSRGKEHCHSIYNSTRHMKIGQKP